MVCLPALDDESAQKGDFSGLPESNSRTGELGRAQFDGAHEVDDCFADLVVCRVVKLLEI